MNPVKNKKIYIETYGCQMNFSDSEIVASILNGQGYENTTDIGSADVIFINTCSIRDHAEQRVRKRLQAFRPLKKKNPALLVGLLGCMGERLKSDLLEEEKVLDIVAGPDVYRDLPRLLEMAESGVRAINTILSLDETYADITPVRLDSNGVSAFISIMRGCENYCAYCVVPFVRGRERSRDMESILFEASDLFKKGFREITLLGQNVNSYQWNKDGTSINFAHLLEEAARRNPQVRFRFATSHPKDLSDELLGVITSLPNACKSIHLPVQSGSTKILKKMKRGYTREQYLERLQAIRRIIPGCAISTDIITGFCDEEKEDHRLTLSLMHEAAFDYAYMFRYSERPDTFAAGHYSDNVPEEVKDRRLREVIALQQKLSYESNKRDINKTVEVLIEGDSRRSPDFFSGRNTANKVVVFPKTANKPGDYVMVRITKVTSATLIGQVV